MNSLTQLKILGFSYSSRMLLLLVLSLVAVSHNPAEVSVQYTPTPFGQPLDLP